MKKIILKATAVWFALALAGTLACGGGSGGGCGGGSTPATGAGSGATLPCGRGTHQEGGQCVANSGSSSGGTTSTSASAPAQAAPLSVSH